ncbi:MAG: methylated-DNA--[protein]-cysteine S-methyltransferase [Pseudomonadota bacterium]
MQQVKSENGYDVVFDSPPGRLGIRCRDDRITRLDYLANTAPLKAATTPFEQRILKQLAQFFVNPGHHFRLALDMQGTDFQCRVWQALTEIPAGQTLTYGELAARLDSGARAVGNACRNNPVSVIVPCHRVVSATGIGGYSGSTGGREIQRKQWLLRHEGIVGSVLKTRKKAPYTGLHNSQQRNLHA